MNSLKELLRLSVSYSPIYLALWVFNSQYDVNVWMFLVQYIVFRVAVHTKTDIYHRLS